MTGHGAAEEGPDLAAEARFWREWNTAVFERTRSREEAAKIAARLSPDPERIQALLSRARTASALSQPAEAGGDDELIAIHAAAGRFYQSRLGQSWVPAYLAERGLDAVLLPASPWKIGYAPGSWTALTRHLRDLGHSDEAMLRSGLVAKGKNGRLHDRFRDRLMIPIRRASDRAVIAFVGRRHPGAGDDHGPKYLNSPGTELYAKGQALMGLAEGHRSLACGAQPVITEGPLDAIAVSIAAPGTYTGITTCGTALTAAQAALLARTVDLSETGVRLAFDPDTAGRTAAIRAYPPLSQVTGDITAVLLNGADPAATLQKHGRHRLSQALTGSIRPLADLVIDARIAAWQHNGTLNSVEQQLGALRACAKLIATMPPGEAATQATRLCALFSDRHGWKPQDVSSELVESVDRHFLDTRPTQAGTSLPRRPAGLPYGAAEAVVRGTAPYSARMSGHPPAPETSASAERGRARPLTRTKRGGDGRG
ncbi:MAG: toprim domain-containing protein [Actinobacteria bacterium]|nr:toprim domain-containing protein [Actinomycetota bacterium]